MADQSAVDGTERKILILGATGPSGICLLREMLYRSHAVITYVRNPSKIPVDISLNPLLEIVKGEMDDMSALSAVIARSSLVMSLLGPPGLKNHPPCALWYSNVLNLMRENGVKRIWGTCASTCNQPGDQGNMTGSALIFIARTFFPELWTTARSVEQAFVKDGDGLEWTVFRVGRLQGSSDKETWKKDRNSEMFEGGYGQKGWTTSTNRSGLAHWLVDCVETEQDKWVGKMPSVSDLAGAKDIKW
ncbi:hypothetical protein BX600DRAFT_498301 [Xylariales sp. PMI_506]|nr:hypothetical protein BX600DRAFT_498301 [Xylariales sp. PMI_506]